MLTLMPDRFTACVTRTASAISVPATKRPETRCPIAERSAKLHKERFSERWTKKVLNMESLPPRNELGCATEERWSWSELGRPQNFVSQSRLTGCDPTLTRRVRVGMSTPAVPPPSTDTYQV